MQQIADDLEMSRQLRVDGVPYMVFAGQYAIAGAHMPEHIMPVIDGSIGKHKNRNIKDGHQRSPTRSCRTDCRHSTAFPALATVLPRQDGSDQVATNTPSLTCNPAN